MTSMTSRISRRTAVLCAVLLAVLLGCGAAVAYHRWATDDSDLTDMKAYGPDRQNDAAHSIVAGLNTHDVKKVELLRNTSAVPDAAADNAQIDQNIGAAMPPAGCSYTLESVTDRGSLGEQTLPWASAHQTWRFDMHLQQNCPGQAPAPRTIGVLATPSGMGGYWAEAALVVEP
jgi:hypothetical protein